MALGAADKGSLVRVLGEKTGRTPGPASVSSLSPSVTEETQGSSLAETQGSSLTETQGSGKIPGQCWETGES